ncbi:MAG TPA: methyltransferase domain-containing protein [Pseudonocardia sp.]|jgi:SAM-dependent methyltransferase
MSEQSVAQHYSHGALEEHILGALAEIGVDPEHLEPDQLAPVDEFHIGGRAATVALVDQMDLHAGLRVLDVGSGLGGTARYLAHHHGVTVTGIDLTEEYVQVAGSLTRRAGLAEQVTFHQGSATALPFDDHSFDRACMLHVGMNIADKQAVFAEVVRVLTDDGTFGLYDVMRTGTVEPTYPVPWASTSATSFLGEPAHYRELLSSAGLSVALERDRSEFGVAFFRRLRAVIAESGPPALGLHILMGQDAATKVANMIDNLERGLIAPVEMICQRSET